MNSTNAEEAHPSGRPSSPSNLVIVSVTCCANEIWNGSSNSSEVVDSEPSVPSDTLPLIKSSSAVGESILKSKCNALKPSNIKPQSMSIVINRRSRMPVLPNKIHLISSGDLKDKSQLNLVKVCENKLTSDEILDTNAQTTNSIHENLDIKYHQDSKLEMNFGYEVEVKCSDKMEPQSCHSNLSKDDTSLGEKSSSNEELENDVDESKNLPENDLKASSASKRSYKRWTLCASRRSTRKRQSVSLQENKSNEVTERLRPDSEIANVTDEMKTSNLALLTRPPLPQRTSRKYGRKSISSLDSQATSKYETLTGQDVEASEADSSETLEKPIENASEPDKKKKGCHRNRVTGDLVWVKISGKPWWPAQISEDKKSGDFKRNKISSKNASSYMTEYHITTFGTPPINNWVLANYLLDFRGRKKFEDYVTTLMQPIPCDSALYTQLKWRFCVKDTIREKWEGIVKEIEDTYKSQIEEQGEKDLIDPQPPTKAKKRALQQKENIDQSDEIPLKRQKIHLKNEEIASQSKTGINKIITDVFQDAPVGKRKRTISIKMKESQQSEVKLNLTKPFGKKIAKKNVTLTSSHEADRNFPIKGIKTFSSKIAPKNKSQTDKKRPPKKSNLSKCEIKMDSIVKGSKLRELLTVSEIETNLNQESSKAASIKKRNKCNSQEENVQLKKKSKSNGKPSSDEQNSAVPIKPKQKKQTPNGLTPTKKREDRYVERVCHICETMIMSDQTVRCHGICKSVVHFSCANPSLTSDGPNEDYKCETCISGNHACFVCKSIDGEVLPCRATHCGKLYHTECLDQFRSSRIDEQSVMCPSHSCMSCTLSYSRVQSFNGNRSYRCIRCPFAYHANDFCVPAGSIILSNSVIICPRHYKPKKPRKDRPQHVNVNWCFVCSNGGSLICCESCPASFHAECINIEPPEGSYYCCECLSGMQPRYGDIVWVKLGNYRWWPAKICNPKNVPINISNLPHEVGEFPVCFFGTNDFHWTSRARVFHFLEGDQGAHITSSTSSGLAKRFQTALAEACEAFKEWKAAKEVAADRYNSTSSTRPPYYKHILTNRPFGKVTMHTSNLSMMTPCECNPNSENPCSSDTECLNRMLMFECHSAVCLAGERCNNQRFQKRQYPLTETFLCEGKGWGLKCLTDIKKGEFVNEYVGEIIDEEECRRRMKKMHEENNTSYYFLTIDKDRIIDAGQKGNYSRFMNHSCKPNNETRKWTVNGDTRVGLFAVCDIPAGTELTFNYNLDCLGNEKIHCKCGEPNCSIYIGERPKVVKEIKPNSKRKSESTRRKKKKSRLSRVEHDDLCFRCGEDGHLVLCDRKGCTKAFHLNCLDMTKPPHGRWECPWHHCYHCGKPSKSLCLICPNSFCLEHSAGNINLFPDGNFYCNEHTEDPFEQSNGGETIVSSSMKLTDNLEILDQPIEVKNEAKNENSDGTNSIFSTTAKLNGAEIKIDESDTNRDSKVRKRSTRRRISTNSKTPQQADSVQENSSYKDSKPILNVDQIKGTTVNDKMKPTPLPPKTKSILKKGKAKANIKNNRNANKVVNESTANDERMKQIDKESETEQRTGEYFNEDITNGNPQLVSSEDAKINFRDKTDESSIDLNLNVKLSEEENCLNLEKFKQTEEHC